MSDQVRNDTAAELIAVHYQKTYEMAFDMSRRRDLHFLYLLGVTLVGVLISPTTLALLLEIAADYLVV